MTDGPSPTSSVYLAGRKTSPWAVLGVAVTAQVGLAIADQGLPLLAGFVKHEFAVSAALAGAIVSAFTFGRFFGSYAAGVAADRFDESRILLLGGLVTAVFLLIAAVAPLGALVVLLFIAGVGGSTSTPAGGRLVAHSFPRHRVGLALGMRQTGIPIGALVAALVLPPIAAALGWRYAVATAALFAGALVLPVLIIRDMDTPRASEPREGDRHGVGREVVLLSAWNCLFVTGQFSLLAFLALDVHSGTGVSLAAASLLLAIVQVTGIAGRVLWGVAGDASAGVGGQRLLLLITMLGVLSAIMLAALPRTMPFAVFGALAALAGLTLVGYQGHWIRMITDAAGPARQGAATGFAITFVTLAAALTPPAFGLVADVAGTYRAVWVALAIVLTLAFVPAALLRSPQGPTQLCLSHREAPRV